MRTTSSRAGTEPTQQIPQSTLKSAGPEPQIAIAGTQPGRYEYEVCTSFAGEDRTLVETVLQRRGVKCFYDLEGQENLLDRQSDLLGKNPFTLLNRIYRKRARRRLMFVSGHYPTEQWAYHERKSIQDRMSGSTEQYLIPIRLDDKEIPSVLPPCDHIDGRHNSPSRIAALIQKKIRSKAVPKSGSKRTRAN